MKNPKSNNQPQKNQKKEEVKEAAFELIIDTNDSYKENLNIFYLHPVRLSHLNFVNDKIFDEATVMNSHVDFLSSINLNFILKKMKINSKLNIIICQPLSVMQSYDAKQIEANCRLAGFNEIETSEYEDPDTKLKTKLVTAIRPERNPNLIEVELVKSDTKISAKVKN